MQTQTRRLAEYRPKYSVGYVNHPLGKVHRAAAVQPRPVETVQQLQERDDFASDRRPIILFDGVCNLCNTGVNIMLDWDRKGAFRLAALQSRAGRRLLQRCGRQPTDISSIVLVQQDAHYIKSEAVLRIASELALPMPAAAFLARLAPLVVRDVVYDAVADNRYALLGNTSYCRMSDDGFQDRFIVD